MKTRMSIVVGAIAFGTIAALAHGGATGIVKERMDAMSAMAKAMKSIGSIIQGKEKYDKEVVKAAAKTIGDHAGENLTKLFPENVKQNASEASDEIWQNWEEFEAMSRRLRGLANGLELAADAGPDGIDGSITLDGGELPPLDQLGKASFRTLFMQIGKSCSSCHEKYRIQKQ